MNPTNLLRKLMTLNSEADRRRSHLGAPTDSNRRTLSMMHARGFALNLKIALTAGVLSSVLGTAMAQSAYDLVLLPTGLTSTGGTPARGVTSSGHVLFTPGDGAAALWTKTATGSQTTSIPTLESGLPIGPAAIAVVNGADAIVGTAFITPTAPLSGLPDYQINTAAFIWTASAGTQNLNALSLRTDWYFLGASAISDGGYVVGAGVYFDPAANTWRGVGYRLNLASGVVTALLPPLSLFTAAVNTDGDVIFGNSTYGYFLGGTADASFSIGVAYPEDISDNGHIAGAHYNPGLMRACYLASPTSAVQSLGTLGGGRFSHGYGVNGSGVVVGSATTGGDFANPPWDAFRWKPGDSKLTDLNSYKPKGSKWLLRGAYRVNESGWIVGEAVNGTTVAAFVLIPK